MPRFSDDITKTSDSDALLEEILKRIQAQNALDNRLVDHIIWPESVRLWFE